MLKKGASQQLQQTQYNGNFWAIFFFSFKNGWGKFADSEFEIFEQFHTLTSPKYDLKDEYFRHTSAHGRKEECKVSLEREFVRIPMSVLWSRTCFSDFYETTKNSKSSVKANQCNYNYISRQYASLESKIFSTYPGPGNIGFSIAKNSFIINWHQ